MINSKNFVNCIIANRYFFYQNSVTKTYAIYENMPEDGSEVRRKIATVKNEAQAQAFVKIQEREVQDIP